MREKEYTNRLIHESSPYLRQHAHNPVDWHPWGEEAFSKALRMDKAIFLSIGYSTCRWCHVMERETFSDERAAKFLNEHFICIKVDREEHPEVDAQYMEFAQTLLKSSSGWPLNVFLTPEKKPFFAMTYLPLEARHGLAGFIEVIEKISNYWHSDKRQTLERQAEQIVDAFSERVRTSGEKIPSRTILKNALETTLRFVDPVFGGLQGIPKFPAPPLYMFLLRSAIEEADSRPAFFVMRTLDKIRQGGIFDHLGGGFARYSIDEEWKIPHFEKMLPDNALLAECFLEAWQATQQVRYRNTAEKTILFLKDEFYQEGKGFAAAFDAESEGEEGKYYAWTKEEVVKVLGEKGEEFLNFYSFLKPPNFHDSYLLYQEITPEEYAKKKGLDADAFFAYLDECHSSLLKERNKREKPFLDTKIVASWNGAAIHLFAKSAKALQKPQLLEIAENSCSFILKNLWREDTLAHCWIEKQVSPPILDDYAYMIRALLSLFEATSSLYYLHWAKHFTTILEMEYKAKKGAFYQTKEEKQLLLRRCVFADGSEPSGNGVHCQNLLRLYQLTFEESYLEQAEDILRAAEPFIHFYPPGYASILIDVFHYYDVNAPSFVVVLNEQQSNKEELENLLWKSFIPNKTILFIQEGDEKLSKYLPVLTQYLCKKGKTTLYICQRGRCQNPLTEFEPIVEAVKKLEKKVIHSV